MIHLMRRYLSEPNPRIVWTTLFINEQTAKEKSLRMLGAKDPFERSLSSSHRNQPIIS